MSKSMFRRLAPDWRRIFDCVDQKIKQFIRDSLGFTIILVSLLEVFQHSVLLSHLEATTVKLTGIVWGALSDGPPDRARQDPGIRVVSISESVYDEDFNQASPLDRRVLKPIIAALADAKPGVLAIDLDLSPGQHADPRGGEEELERLLLERAHAGLQIVVIAPQPAANGELQQTKLAWMKRLCDANIRFGLAHLAVQDGTVVRFDNRQPILAAVAYRSARGEKAMAGEPCEAAQRNEVRKAIFLDPAFDPYAGSTGRGEMPLINTKYLFDTSDQLTAIALSELKPEFLETARSGIRQGSLVILGGAFGDSDRHATVLGDRYGVFIHAAQFGSLRDKAELPGRLKEFLSPKYLNPVAHFVAGFLYAVVMSAAWRRAIVGQIQLQRVIRARDRRTGVWNTVSGYAWLAAGALGLLVASCLVTVWGLEWGVELDLGALWFAFFVESAHHAGKIAVEEGVRHEIEFQRAGIIRRLQHGRPDYGELRSIEAVLRRLANRHRDRLADKCRFPKYCVFRFRRIWRELRLDLLDLFAPSRAADGRIAGSRWLALGAISYQALVLTLFFAAFVRLLRT